MHIPFSDAVKGSPGLREEEQVSIRTSDRLPGRGVDEDARSTGLP